MAAIIFDFDGTIVDNRDYFIEFIAKEAGHWPLSKEQEASLAGLPLLFMARQLGVRWYYLPQLYFKGRKRMDRVISTFKPVQEMPELIKKLHNEGHELFILSSNSVRNIRLFLKHNHLREYFMEIYGGVAVFGKAGQLHKLLRENNLKVKEAIAVGDEIRDVVAAQAVGMRVVAVTWGLCSDQDLAKFKPTAIAHDSKELLGLLEEI
ncbi:MAG TPA: HAD-IA family hydrolase [Candidatus Saccharimonadales bacterium]|nr:HAD-IA family hydrolase [Candidatus Saccharimonadales bacterium]